jgi:hypothetical protein
MRSSGDGAVSGPGATGEMDDSLASVLAADIRHSIFSAQL